MSLEVLRILDCPVHAVDLRRALEAIAPEKGARGPGRPKIVVALNAEKVMAAADDPELRTLLQHATLVLPDGVGVVLAARLLAHRRIPRVPGIDFLEAALAQAAKTGRSVFLLGGAPGVAERAGRRARERYPGLLLAGTHHGFDPDPTRVLERIGEARPDHLFLGLGSPRQERWIAAHAHELPVGLMMGVGGSLDVLAGEVRRAPRVFRRAGLEWLYRLGQEPSRWRRMLALPRFVGRVLVQLAVGMPVVDGDLP